MPNHVAQADTTQSASSKQEPFDGHLGRALCFCLISSRSASSLWMAARRSCSDGKMLQTSDVVHFKGAGPQFWQTSCRAKSPPTTSHKFPTPNSHWMAQNIFTTQMVQTQEAFKAHELRKREFGFCLSASPLTPPNPLLLHQLL